MAGKQRMIWQAAALALTVLLLTLTGLGLAVPGAYLLTLGGSPYYLVAGLAALGSAVLLARRDRLGLHLYGLILLATLVWSVWESGLYGWALMPRLVFLAVAGLWLFAIRHSLAPPDRRWRTPVRAATGVLTLALVGITIVAATHAPADESGTAGDGPPKATLAPEGEWTHVGATAYGTRYSPLAQITPANAGSLERAWVYRTGLNLPGGKRKGGLQVTPLLVDGTLYGCTAFSGVFALDPVTGRQLWRHEALSADPKGGHPVCRGVAFYRAPSGTAECPSRILLGTVDNRLIALDAKTGAPCRSFGTDGATSLLDNVGDFPPGWSHPTSPPTIVDGTAVMGAYVVDNQSTNVPPGVIRGYDAVSGKLRWAFDPGRPDDTRPPAPGQVYTPSTPNSWTLASGDEALGLVYVPMGNGSPDFVGGHRTPETDRFTSSVVALEAATGAVRWTFQAVHHDLWDYDLAAQPVLVDFPVGSGTVPGLLLPTKTGQIFVLDRRTGKPLTKVEERPVPRSTLAGERSAPTQPYSVEMPDFAGPPLTEAKMWGLTPFDQLYCRIKFQQAHYEGVYTPPRFGPTIRYPGELGGIDWGSVSVDEGRQLLLVNSNRMADYDLLITRAEADRRGIKPRRGRGGGHSPPGAAMEGTPYAVVWSAFTSGLEVPCQQPPYGHLTAVDLKTRKVVWSRTLGNARNSGPWGYALHLPFPLGAPNIGGSVTTGGGVTFIAATQDEMIRAIETRTGKTLWETQLPAGGHATPMTYRGRDGRQYVVIAAAGQSLKDKPGDYFMAFRLK